LAASFNAAVLKRLAGLKSDGLKVFTLETYDLLEEIKKDPSGFGFMNVTDPCWTGNFTDPWDEVHPTAAGHLLAAEFAVDALATVPRSRPGR
jgi:cholinesterase